MELITTKVCMTKDLGVHGNLFGGIMLAWLDEAGAAFACEKAQSTHMVTRYINSVEFSRPVREGRIVKIYGDVMNYGKSSIKVKLSAKSYNPHSGKLKDVCATEMVFVRIDDDGDSLVINRWDNMGANGID